jgi:uncharacterized damage-inducible protein DinB
MSNQIAQGFLMELEHESQATLKILGALPEDKFDYKPHGKSMTAGELASHIAEALQWAEVTCKEDGMVMDPAKYVPYKAESKADLLETFDKNLKIAKEAIGSTSDEAMMSIWSMKMAPDNHVAFEMPKLVVLRSFIFNHGVHHRAQLGVYLRLLDVEVPQVYGPTADFPEMM